MMHKIVKVELKRAVALHAYQLAHQIEVARLTVGREAHDFAFVAILGKAQPLTHGGVEDAERVRKIDLVLHLELIIRAGAPHGRDEIARAIHREDRRVFEGRDKKRGRHMRPVMFDIVIIRLEFAHAQMPGKFVLERADLHRVLQTVAHEVEAGTLAEGEQRRLQQIGFRVAADADVIEVIGGDAGDAQHIADRLHGEARPVFRAVEAFFFDCGDELAVLNEAGRRAAVIRVDSENIHHESYEVRMTKRGSLYEGNGIGDRLSEQAEIAPRQTESGHVRTENHAILKGTEKHGG